MKNDCINTHCIYREEDGSCETVINYCKKYIPPKFHEISTKHSNLFVKGLATGLNTSEEFQKLYENMIKLERLSGYSLDKLLEMFAVGWTLEPPKKSCMVSELMKEFE